VNKRKCIFIHNWWPVYKPFPSVMVIEDRRKCARCGQVQILATGGFLPFLFSPKWKNIEGVSGAER